MHQRNFPERKNQRRKRALVRLEQALKNNPDSFGLKMAIRDTKAKIVDSALGVKTRKYRGK